MTLVFLVEFDSGLTESIIPDKIRFTTSKNDQTSTLTLTFYNLSIFFNHNNIGINKKLLKSISFKTQNYTLSTRDIKIIWLKGRPFLLEAIFLITSEIESVALKKLFNSLSKKNI